MKKTLSILLTCGLIMGAAYPAAAEDAGGKTGLNGTEPATARPFSFSMSLGRPGSPDEPAAKRQADTSAAADYPYEIAAGLLSPTDGLAKLDQDAKGLNLSLGADLQTGNLNAGLVYFHAAGDELESLEDNYRAYSQDLDSAFAPMYILTGKFPERGKQSAGSSQGFSQSGLEGVVVHAGYDVNNRLRIKGAFGLAKGSKESKQDETVLSDEYYGWEVNLGASYKLLDNLLYEAHFGYLNTGDYFDGYAIDAGQSGAYENFIYRLTHKLTMKF